MCFQNRNKSRDLSACPIGGRTLNMLIRMSRDSLKDCVRVDKEEKEKRFQRFPHPYVKPTTKMLFKTKSYD